MPQNCEKAIEVFTICFQMQALFRLLYGSIHSHANISATRTVVVKVYQGAMPN